MKLRLAVLTGLWSLYSLSLVAAEPAPATNEAAGDAQAALEKQFEQTMTGATLVGHYTNSKATDPNLAAEERYLIEKVTKLKDDTWQFDAGIRYGDHNVTLPLKLEVKWAGDTPVITLTKFPVLGLGTFTARVLVYDHQYAGTWSGGDHGGQLFGRVVRTAAVADKKPADKPALPGKSLEKPATGGK